MKKEDWEIPSNLQPDPSDYSFDLEAQGALEKAMAQFGPLPQGFPDDVLPVVFSFDPRLIH